MLRWSVRSHTGKVFTETALPLKIARRLWNLFFLFHICLSSKSQRKCWISSPEKQVTGWGSRWLCDSSVRFPTRWLSYVFLTSLLQNVCFMFSHIVYTEIKPTLNKPQELGVSLFTSIPPHPPDGIVVFMTLCSLISVPIFSLYGRGISSTFTSLPLKGIS